MTPPELLAARTALGWNRAVLAQLLACSEATIRQMENGHRHVPPSIAQWLTQLAQYHMAHPPPQNWRVR